MKYDRREVDAANAQGRALEIHVVDTCLCGGVNEFLA